MDDAAPAPVPAGPPPEYTYASPSWPPAHCKGLQPASRPKVAGARRRALLATLLPRVPARRLLSEAATKLLVDSKPPDEALRRKVYDYLRDFMASEVRARVVINSTWLQECARS